LFAEPLDVTHGDIQRTPQKLDKPPSSNPFLRTTAEIYATVRFTWLSSVKNRFFQRDFFAFGKEVSSGIWLRLEDRDRNFNGNFQSIS
ncbi:MAG: hypothetical protein ACREX9_07665, partial [Gammaproteobacteria bacterium]